MSRFMKIKLNWALHARYMDPMLVSFSLHMTSHEERYINKGCTYQ